HRANGDLVEVVYQYSLWLKVGLIDDVEASTGTGRLVPVWGVHQDWQVVLGCQLKLLGERFVLGCGHRVIADLTDRDHPVLVEVARQYVQHWRTTRVVGLLGVQREGAVVPDAELCGAEPFPADQRIEVVSEAPDTCTRLPEPKGGLDHGPDTRGVHGLIIISGTRGHVNVRVEDPQFSLLAIGARRWA